MAHRGLYKREGIWQIRYSLNGKIMRKSTGTSNFKKAEVKLRAIKTLIDEGKEPEKKIESHTFAQLVEAYKKDYLQGTPSEKVKGYILDSLVKRPISINDFSVTLGLLPLRKFDTRLMERLQKDLTAKGLKDASVNKVINTLKHAFTKAVDWNMVEESVRKTFRKVEMFKEIGRLRYLSAEEATSLISVCDDHLRPIVITALHTGMRKGEILKLKWDNIDLQHGFIQIPKTKNGERRDIPIDGTLKETLNKLPRHFTGEKENRQLVPYVFHDPKTFKPYDDVKRSFHTALDRAGIKDFHFHDLRHTYASLAMMSGEIDITTLSKLLGHKSLKMTMRYAHFAPAHMKQAARAMDKVFGAVTTAERTDTQLTHQAVKEPENEVVYVGQLLKS